MSSILVDNLTGKTTAGNVTVTSEGGAATMHMQQGLCKTWINFNGTGTIATRDSFNVSGVTDNGTGDFSVNYANNMGNDDYAFGGHTPNAGSTMNFHWINDLANDYTTALLRTRTLFTNNFTGGGSNQDPVLCTLTTSGDLA
tara:strand:- start:416 stop:841 length:426 start_codon:yes stop_codon:yes gene_type:complete